MIKRQEDIEIIEEKRDNVAREYKRKQQKRRAIVQDVSGLGLTTNHRLKGGHKQAKFQDYYDKIVEPKLEFIEVWSRNGGSVEKLAALLGIPVDSFKAMILLYPDLKAVMEDSRFIAELNIESAMYQLACGYEYTETKHEEKQNPKTGQIQMLTTKTRKQVAPSMAAAQLWLEHYGKNWGTAKLDRKYRKKQIELLEAQIEQIKQGGSDTEALVAYQKAFMDCMKQASKDVWKDVERDDDNEQ